MIDFFILKRLLLNSFPYMELFFLVNSIFKLCIENNGKNYYKVSSEKTLFTNISV